MKPRPIIAITLVVTVILVGGLLFSVAYNARGRDNDLAVAMDSALATKTLPPTVTRGPTPTPIYAIVVSDLGRENFSYRLDLGIDGADNIYVANPKTGQVQVFDSAGESLTEWTIEIEGASGGVEAVDDQGRLYTIINGNLYQYDGLTGQRLQQIDYERGPGFRAVAVTPAGGLAAVWNRNWQAEQPGENDLVLFDSEGQVIASIEETWPSAFVIADGSGNLFTTEFNSILKYSSNGQFQLEFKKVLPGSFTVNSAGQLFVAYYDVTSLANNNSQANWRLNVYSPEGLFLYYHSLGKTPPTDLAFNHQGELIMVGEINNLNRVYKFRPSP